jgi:hypothetical protein
MFSVAVKLKDIFGESERIYASAPCRQRSETNHDTAEQLVNIKAGSPSANNSSSRLYVLTFLSNSNTLAESLT